MTSPLDELLRVTMDQYTLNIIDVVDNQDHLMLEKLIKYPYQTDEYKARQATRRFEEACYEAEYQEDLVRQIMADLDLDAANIPAGVAQIVGWFRDHDFDDEDWDY